MSKSSLLESLRAQAAAKPTASSVATTNTKAPLTEIDQAVLRAHIANNCAGWLLAFYDISIATGWRTNDVCSMKYSNINFESGVASIVVAKQTKQAQARALTKVIEQVRQTHKDSAIAAGDSAAFMRLSTATHDQIVELMTVQQKEQALEAVSKAKQKHDQKALPAALLQLLAEMKAQKGAADEDFIFTRALSNSNNGTGKTSGHLSRVTVWSHMKKAVEAVEKIIETAAKKLSAYSLRKTFATNLLKISGKIEIVMAAFGHSSTAITQRYLNLEDSAEQYQIEMIKGLNN